MRRGSPRWSPTWCATASSSKQLAGFFEGRSRRPRRQLRRVAMAEAAEHQRADAAVREEFLVDAGGVVAADRSAIEAERACRQDEIRRLQRAVEARRAL